MRYIVDATNKKIEILDAGSIEEVRNVKEIFKDYTFCFSAEETRYLFVNRDGTLTTATFDPYKDENETQRMIQSSKGIQKGNEYINLHTK